MNKDRLHSRNIPVYSEDGKRKWRFTVVGIGNKERGDDGAGILAVRMLIDKVPADVRTAELTGDQFDLLELMRSTDALIITDAVRSSAAAGTVFRVDIGKEGVPTEHFTSSSHGFDCAQVIELARTLKELPKKVIFFGIVGKEFSYSSGLSREVEESLRIVETAILMELEVETEAVGPRGPGVLR